MYVLSDRNTQGWDDHHAFAGHVSEREDLVEYVYAIHDAGFDQSDEDAS